MNVIKECAECQRLWRQYSESIREDGQVKAKLRVAVLSHQSEHVLTLIAAVKQAQDDRLAARRAIELHASVAHDGVKGAAAP